MGTIVLNFAHPITDEHLKQLSGFRGGLEIDRVIDLAFHFTEESSYSEQLVALVARAGLTSREWQTLPLLVNPPGFAPIATMLFAYLHGLRGEFPDMIRFVRAEDGTFLVAGIVSLQLIRESGRLARVEGMTA